MRTFVILAVSAAVLGAGVVAGVALADPNPTLTTTAHRHYINGREVGPRYCDDETLLGAFTQFHANIHSHNGVTGEIGDPAPGIASSGPSQNTISSGPC
jgi:hypothetical protein